MSNVSNNNEVRPKFKEVIPAERIDFVFEEQTRTLSIQVKYSWFLAEDPLVSEMLCLPIIAAAHNNNNNNNINNQPRRQGGRKIAAGTSFVKGGNYYEVSTSNIDFIEAISVDNLEEVITLATDDAWEIILDKIG